MLVLSRHTLAQHCDAHSSWTARLRVGCSWRELGAGARIGQAGDGIAGPGGGTRAGREARVTRARRVAAAQRVAIPAYAYPYPGDPYWAQLLAGAPQVRLLVADPADGPGTRSDPHYAAAIDQARQRGILVLGYVTLDYGARPGAEVEADIERWYTWYAPDGIFIDLVPTSAEHVEACHALYAATKRRSASSGLVVLNPGTHTLEAYMDTCDILLGSESTWATYRHAYPQAPAWVNTYPAQRFWHVVHACPTEAEMRTALWLARKRNAGWIFVTDHTGLNAYDKLPSGEYWASELGRAVRSADPRRRVPGDHDGAI